MGRSALGTLLVAVAVAIVVAACGGAASPGPAATPGPAGETPPDFTLPPLPGPGDEGEATLRLANAYVPLEGAPPELYLYAGDAVRPGDAPLARVPFGTVSDYFPIPLETVTVSVGPLRDERDTNVRVFSDLADGDSISLLVHAYYDTGSLYLSTFSIAEAGSGVAAQWQAAPAGVATFLVYPGALQWQGVEGAEYSFFYVAGGDCLHSRADGGDDSYGFGGNVPQLYHVAPGTVQLGASTDGCDGEPTIGPARIEVAAGGRVAVLPYGLEKDLRFLVLEVPKP